MNPLKKTLISLICLSSISMAYETLAIVNGHNVTTDVAPKKFKTMDKDLQKKIVNRLIDKRLACDYALSTPMTKSKEFKKVLKHILQMSDKKDDTTSLSNVLKKHAKIKGYTEEQLYSKKGLLAFDFLVNEKAKTIKLTKKELLDYYKTHKYKYDTPAMKELLTIIVDKKQTANMIIDKLIKSKDKLQTFSTLAKQYSLAPSANENGYFGKIPTNEINEKLKPYLENLKKAQFTKKPIETEFGYQIYYVLNDIPKFDSTYDLVQNKVQNELMQKKVKEWATNTIAKLRKEAKIEYKF